MDHALVLPIPISVSPTQLDFLPSELQLPIAPQTLKSLLVSSSTVPPKAMRRYWPEESRAKTCKREGADRGKRGRSKEGRDRGWGTERTSGGKHGKIHWG